MQISAVARWLLSTPLLIIPTLHVLMPACPERVWHQRERGEGGVSPDEIRVNRLEQFARRKYLGSGLSFLFPALCLALLSLPPSPPPPRRGASFITCASKASCTSPRKTPQHVHQNQATTPPTIDVCIQLSHPRQVSLSVACSSLSSNLQAIDFLSGYEGTDKSRIEGGSSP
jgi:hypothetical protein